MDAYLETLFERAFDREVVQAESVFNSLSFFVAAMALTVNVVGYIAVKLPAFRPSVYSAATYAGMALEAGLMAAVIGTLFVGVRERVYRIPPKETDTLEWARALRAYYGQNGLRDQALDSAVIADLRGEMVSEFAQAVVHNRAQNAVRTSARTLGISLMVTQLALAFLIVATIFVHDRFIPA
jgi:hypothetical protein